MLSLPAPDLSSTALPDLASATLLPALLEHLPDPLLVFSRSGQLIASNPAARKLVESGFLDLVRQGSDTTGTSSGLVALAPGSGASISLKPVKEAGATVSFEHFHAPLDRWLDIRAFPVGKDSFALLSHDVTDRKKVEDAWRESQLGLTTAIDIARLGVWEYEIPSGRTRTDERCREIFGCNSDGLTSEQIMELIHPEDRERVLKQVSAALEPEGPGKYEAEYRLADNGRGERWVEARGRAIRPKGVPDGPMLKFVGTVMDITELKHNEEMLRSSRQRLRLALDAGYLGDWQWTEGTDVVSLSPRACEIFGIPESHRPTWEEIRSWMPPEHSALAGRAVSEALEMKRDYSIEYLICRPSDHKEVWVAARGRGLYDGAGKATGMIGVVQDITDQTEGENALQESEERLRFALASAGMGMWEWDTRTGRGTVTAQNQRLFGLPETNLEPDHEDYANLIHPDDLERVSREFLNAAQTGSHYNAEYRIRRPDGSERWIHSEGMRTRRSSGAPIFVGVSRDITERKNAENALRQAQADLRMHALSLEQTVRERTAQLEEAVHELEQYAYSISHDIRAPLRAMNQFSQFVLEDCGDHLSADGRRYLERISSAAGRLDHLIRDVLSYHRLRGQPIPTERVELDSLVEELIRESPYLQAHAAGIKVEHPLAAVIANPAALNQVLSNLLGNAVKFVANGRSPEITVRTECRGAVVRTWVEDKGIGIDAAQVGRVWEIFHRSHSGYEGTGIGLSIVKKAVERMGGTVGVESKRGIGSKFWFELPAPQN